MIQETCTRIEELEDYWTSEIRARHARRNKIRDIDDMLNQFEMLNLADEQVDPAELRQRVAAFVRAEAIHWASATPAGGRHPRLDGGAVRRPGRPDDPVPGRHRLTRPTGRRLPGVL